MEGEHIAPDAHGWRTCPENRGEESPWATHVNPDGTHLISTWYCWACPQFKSRYHPVTDRHVPEFSPMCEHDWPPVERRLEREYRAKELEAIERSREVMAPIHAKADAERDAWSKELGRMEDEGHEAGRSRAEASEQEFDRDHRRRMKVNERLAGAGQDPTEEE